MTSRPAGEVLVSQRGEPGVGVQNNGLAETAPQTAEEALQVAGGPQTSSGPSVALGGGSSLSVVEGEGEIEVAAEGRDGRRLFRLVVQAPSDLAVARGSQLVSLPDPGSLPDAAKFYARLGGS